MVQLRRPSNKVAERNTTLLSHIKIIKLNHPFWGYRRIWACLSYHHAIKVNKKRVYRLMKEHGLIVKETRLLKAKRVDYPSKPHANKPNQIWGTDMTKVKLPHVGWAYIVLVLDWHTKKIVGHSIALRSKTEDWLEALHDACNQQLPMGARAYPTISLVTDNGCQPTSERYMKECSQLGINQIFTSFNNPKGNADTERMMRTMKEELIWSQEVSSYAQLEHDLKRWVESYNTEYCHSSIGYMPPAVFEKEWIDQQITPLKVA